MHRDEVSALDLGPSRRFRKAGRQLAEQFTDHGVVVYYGGPLDDRVGVVEFSGPDFPSVNGRVLDRRIKSDPSELERIGRQPRRDEFGCVWEDALGIAFYLEGESYAVTVFSRSDFAEAKAV